ncbi:uncharacterized protein LOC112539791 [Tetranychus urticae]|uniref:uncharacterized protein LOC112539791 n=1 Tax=Tetranychus urticae TaxID=32264 RepID=UPI000D65B2C4|nr:uncharacterized protein LOC112539791 [Tetranychus urticae]
MNHLNNIVKITVIFLIQFHCCFNVAPNIDKKKIALLVGREARFSCVSEIQVHPETCRYRIVGKDIQVNTLKECKLTFNCNNTVFVVECCFQAPMDEDIGFSRQPSNPSTSSFNEQLEIKSQNISDASIFKGIYNFNTDWFDFKADKALKIMLLLLLILLTVIIFSIVPCKLWFIVKLMRQKTYKTIDDDGRKQPKLKQMKKLETNLINLESEKSENGNTDEFDPVIDVPLQV